MESIIEFLKESRELAIIIKANGVVFNVSEPVWVGLVPCTNGDLALLVDTYGLLGIDTKKIKNVLYTSDATGYERLEIQLGESTKIILCTENWEDLEDL